MKDPAALLYIDVWKQSTTEMNAITRAYYMDLILHQYDKGSLPENIEELANICRVRFSEFETFKQVFEQVLRHKFKKNDHGRLENEIANDIIRKRKMFLDKRSSSGKISYCIRYARKHLGLLDKDLDTFKKHLKVNDLDTKNEQVLRQVLKQIIELYINGDEDENRIIIDYDFIVSNYHSLCPNMAKVIALNDTRKGYINARFSEYGVEKITEVLMRAGQSDFLNGKNDKAWKADFEWLMRPQNFLKVLEGKYENKGAKFMMP